MSVPLKYFLLRYFMMPVSWRLIILKVKVDCLQNLSILFGSTPQRTILAIPIEIIHHTPIIAGLLLNRSYSLNCTSFFTILTCRLWTSCMVTLEQRQHQSPRADTCHSTSPSYRDQWLWLYVAFPYNRRTPHVNPVLLVPHEGKYVNAVSIYLVWYSFFATPPWTEDMTSAAKLTRHVDDHAMAKNGIYVFWMEMLIDNIW